MTNLESKQHRDIFFQAGRTASAMGVHLSANPYSASHRAWASWAKGYEVASKPIRKFVQRRAGRGIPMDNRLLVRLQ
jgi:hypothetical protein